MELGVIHLELSERTESVEGSRSLKMMDAQQTKRKGPQGPSPHTAGPSWICLPGRRCLQLIMSLEAGTGIKKQWGVRTAWGGGGIRELEGKCFPFPG